MSKSWRDQGDAQAFDDRSWEFHARQFASSARQLMLHYESKRAAPDFDSIMSLTTAQFLICLALELLCKALYLQGGSEPKKRIYTHKVVGLLPTGFLNDGQVKLLEFAQCYVIWAGRYPTPKWTCEESKEEFDLQSVLVDGYEQIDARDFSKAAGVEIVSQLFALYEHIHSAWLPKRDAHSFH